jgi:hypothetical protein
MRFLSFKLFEAKRENLGEAWAPIRLVASAAAEYLGIDSLQNAQVEIHDDSHFSVYDKIGFRFAVENADEDTEFFTVHPNNSATVKVENPLYWPNRGKNSGKKFEF